MFDKSGMLVAFMAALALFSFTAPVAQAQPQNLLWSARQDGWSAIQIHDGCYLIFYQDGWVKGWGGYAAPDLKVSVPEGQCDSGGVAEGPVTIEFVWTMQNYHVMIQLEGTAHQGVLQGPGKLTVGDDENDTSFHLRELGDVRNPMPNFYRDGCEYNDDASGAFSVPADEKCQASGAQAMIEQLRQAGLIGGGSAGSSTPAPTQPTSAAAKGDVFGKCVSLAAEEKRGIQDYWSLNNACSQAITVRYCFKANTENAGNEALCSRSEYRTNDIKANGKLDFTWSLTDEGTPMSNGDVAGPNALKVYGFACTEGMTPQVSFDSGRLAFGGCS
jgi:hypothetical protein